MAITATEVRKIVGLRSIRAMGTLVFSGNYVSAGEVLTLVKPGTTRAAFDVIIRGSSGHQYLYNRVTGKVLILTAAGVELSAAAYPAGVTGDDIRYDAEYPKFG